MGTLITVSDREEDAKFGELVASLSDMKSLNVTRQSELRRALKEESDAVVFWDIDHPGAIEVSSPLSISNIGNVLRGNLDASRIFVITNEPLNSTPYVFNFPIFGHHLYRQYGGPAPHLYSYLVKACRDKFPHGLEYFMPKGVQPKTIVLKNSRERRALSEAILNILTNASTPPQVAQLASQATDELLMNAIFDAPTQGGETYKRKLERNSEFDLSPREQVTLQFANSPGYFGICVRDQFGALKKDLVLGFIRKDYEKQEYKVKEDDPGAGLGVYGILQGGLSMLFACQPNHFTEVMIFLPQVTSMKQFRQQFRFFSFV